MEETVLVPGGRRVEATLTDPGETSACVVACPPHPQFGGNREDRRLVALADALADRGVACLRFDYGDWDEGYGEREDARNAVRWAAERYDAVGLYGYSFGGAVAVLAAASVDARVRAVFLLAPASSLAPDLDAVEALADVDCPVGVAYGVRDETADWEPLVEAIEARGGRTESVGADHHFVGQHEPLAATAAAFLADALD